MTKARSNAVAEAAKGDLSVGTGTNLAGILPVGNSGDTIVADSSTSTGLRWQGSQSAGKNAVINGGMDIWQRGNSFSNAASRIYTADRFMAYRFGFQNNITTSRVSSGLTGFTYAMRNQRTSGDTQTGQMYVDYALESIDSLRFAGQSVTISFYAKAGANFSPTSSLLTVLLRSGTGTDQIFTSMSGAATVVAGNATLTTSWQRFSYTGSVPSGSTQLGFEFTATPTGTAGADDSFDITGVQLELGSVASSFLRTGGTIQGELAACQRYYYRSNALTSVADFAQGLVTSTTNINAVLQIPVPLRTAVATIDYPAMSNFVISDGTTIANPTSITLAQTSTNAVSLSVVYLAFTVGRAGRLYANGTTNAYIGMSAEL